MWEGVSFTAESGAAPSHAPESVCRANVTVVNRKKAFVCPYPNCGKSFLTASGLRKHRQSHEEQEHQFVCDMCKEMRVFKTKEAMLVGVCYV